MVYKRSTFNYKIIGTEKVICKFTRRKIGKRAGLLENRGKIGIM
ncbi:MAG: hypothetical protein RHS_3029 [Robinsoniella sp. RHS]|nr:MAG: hypothetical protein RHS_3029 [Robinsoniella sp. RHS]